MAAPEVPTYGPSSTGATPYPESDFGTLYTKALTDWKNNVASDPYYGAKQAGYTVTPNDSGVTITGADGSNPVADYAKTMGWTDSGDNGAAAMKGYLDQSNRFNQGNFFNQLGIIPLDPRYASEYAGTPDYGTGTNAGASDYLSFQNQLASKYGFPDYNAQLLHTTGAGTMGSDPTLGSYWLPQNRNYQDWNYDYVKALNDKGTGSFIDNYVNNFANSGGLVSALAGGVGSLAAGAGALAPDATESVPLTRVNPETLATEFVGSSNNVLNNAAVNQFLAGGAASGATSGIFNSGTSTGSSVGDKALESGIKSAITSGGDAKQAAKSALTGGAQNFLTTTPFFTPSGVSASGGSMDGLDFSNPDLPSWAGGGAGGGTTPLAGDISGGGNFLTPNVGGGANVFSSPNIFSDSRGQFQQTFDLPGPTGVSRGLAVNDAIDAQLRGGIGSGGALNQAIDANANAKYIAPPAMQIPAAGNVTGTTAADTAGATAGAPQDPNQRPQITKVQPNMVEKALKTLGVYDPTKGTVGPNALPLAGLGYAAYRNNQAGKSAQDQLNKVAQPAQDASKQLIAQGTAGQVPQALQTQIQNTYNQTVQQIKARYARMGRDPDNDSGAAAEIAKAGQDRDAQIANAAQTILNQGLAAAQVANGPAQNAVMAGVNSDTQLAQAMAGTLSQMAMLQYLKERGTTGAPTPSASAVDLSGDAGL